jgi:hypothetical protein
MCFFSFESFCSIVGLQHQMILIQPAGVSKKKGSKNLTALFTFLIAEKFINTRRLFHQTTDTICHGDPENRILKRVGKKLITMKKTLFVCSLILCTFFSNAQKNNPYAQAGVDYAKSIKMITDDVKTGKVKAFSKETLDEYSLKLQVKTKVNMDMVSAIFSTVKNKDFNLVKFVQGSKLSAISKEALITAAVNPRKLDAKQLADYLESKTDEIKKSSIGDSEKEIALSLLAITSSMKERSSPCSGYGPQGSSEIDCGLAGAIGGGIIGWTICGPLCGLGGAIVGGIIGSIS